MAENFDPNKNQEDEWEGFPEGFRPAPHQGNLGIWLLEFDPETNIFENSPNLYRFSTIPSAPVHLSDLKPLMEKDSTEEAENPES